jgi:hypothetical protein
VSPRGRSLVIDVEAMTSRHLADIGGLKTMADTGVDIARVISRKVDDYCERVRRRLADYHRDNPPGKPPLPSS